MREHRPEMLADNRAVVTECVEVSDLQVEISRLTIQLAESVERNARYASLIRESDHRIKNSLQVVSSLMQVQARRETKATVAVALRAAASRVQSIARIHDALQASGGEDAVDLGEVLAIMCRSLHAMAGDPLTVGIIVDVEPLQMPVTLAQPIVLMVNELVLNALRHAFGDGRHGAIRVTAGMLGDEVCVVVADDGVGLPQGYGDGAGFGSKLVRMMTDQIGGKLTVQNDAGAHFMITAPAPGITTCDADRIQTIHGARLSGKRAREGSDASQGA
jgi:two-component sensor histidine kinase